LEVQALGNREQLLKTALELFAARGFDAVGVQEIVQRAGVTKPTLYHYFGSKLGLLEHLLQEHHAPLLAELTAATAYQGDLPQTLTRVVSTFLAFTQGYPDLIRFQSALVYLPAEHEAYPIASHFVHKYRTLLEELFLQASQDHGNMRGRHQRYALTFLGMINGYASLVLNDDLQVTDRLVYEIVHQFSHGIYS
jgi:AcrR family transcriptional regulator